MCLLMDKKTVWVDCDMGYTEIMKKAILFLCLSLSTVYAKYFQNILSSLDEKMQTERFIFKSQELQECK